MTIECQPDGVYVWNVLYPNAIDPTVVFSDSTNFFYPRRNAVTIFNITANLAGKYFCERVIQSDTCVSENKSVITIFGKLVLLFIVAIYVFNVW